MRSVLTAVVAAILIAGPAAAQDDEVVAEVGAALAAAWSAGDAEALVPFLPDEGIDLSLDGNDHRGVARRQARAALARFFDERPRGEVTIRRAEALGGNPPMALVELVWTVGDPGVGEARSWIIFVSLERILDDWCIEEIRVFS